MYISFMDALGILVVGHTHTHTHTVLPPTHKHTEGHPRQLEDHPKNKGHPGTIHGRPDKIAHMRYLHSFRWIRVVGESDAQRRPDVDAHSVSLGKADREHMR